MKNYDSKFNPFAGTGILGVAVPISVYAVGFLATLFYGVIGLLLFPGFYSGELDEHIFLKITAIIATVLQITAIVVLTLIVNAFSKMKIYHVLLSVIVCSALFIIVERFIPVVRASNLPETMVFFPAIFKNWRIRFDVTIIPGFVEKRYFLVTALFLSAACFAIVLTAWAIYQINARKERSKDEL